MIPSNKPFIIGETAFHHQGDKQYLISLIDAAIDCKVDAIKFHLLFDLDDYMVRDHQAKEALSKLCLKKAEWEEVIAHADDVNLKLILLCNDVQSMEWVNALKSPNISAIEIHATGINDIFLLEKSCSFSGTVILGTGGSTIDEIGYAITYLRERGKADIFLMHGFQNYPTQYTDIVLSKMQLLSALFNLPVGYADHTDPADAANEIVSCLGVSMGFNVIEKHFTVSVGEKRIDGQSAVSIEQMKKIIALASLISDARGVDPMLMSAGELKYGDTGPMKKAIVARKSIRKDEVITRSHLAFKRTNRSSYIKQNFIQSLIGQKASRDIEPDEIVDFSNIEFTFKLPDFSQFKANQK
jgi:N,N'-diacetyllegionaminate synthase